MGNKILIDTLVGKNYDDFWNFKGRYRVVKGGRASKKSKTAALNFIYRIMKYPESNLLVCRKVYKSLKNSCFSELMWAIKQLHVESYWDMRLSPLELTYTPTGQKILFRGLDDLQKISSICPETGVLCWIWLEEASEVVCEDDFDMLDEIIRGRMPGNLFKQITLTLNPWSERHFIKRRFFDAPNSDILAKTTTYLDNEFLDEDDIKFFKNMKKNNPKRYRIAGLGEWGIEEDLVFDNFSEQTFEPSKIAARHSVKSVFGLDFGYTTDPSALFCGLVDTKTKEIFVFDEFYEKHLSNKKLYEKICAKGYKKERIRADSSEPKSIDELRSLGMPHILPAQKGAGSVRTGLLYLRDFKIIIHPRCTNFLTEISNYTWDAITLPAKSNPGGNFDHLIDAMRYAMEDIKNDNIFSFT